MLLGRPRQATWLKPTPAFLRLHPHLWVPGAENLHRSRAPCLPLLLLGQKVLGVVGGAAADLAQPVGGPGGVGLVWRGRQARGGLCAAVMNQSMGTTAAEGLTWQTVDSLGVEHLVQQIAKCDPPLVRRHTSRLELSARPPARPACRHSG